MNANPVSNLPPHPACVCGKGKVRGFLCWPCYEASDDEPPAVLRGQRQRATDAHSREGGATMKKLGIILASVAMTFGLVGVTSGPAQADSSWDIVGSR